MREAEKRSHDVLCEACGSIESRWWDVYTNSAIHASVAFRNNVFHSARESEGKGHGIRLNRDGRTGFSYCNDIGDVKTLVGYSMETAQYGEKEEYALPGSSAMPHVQLYDEQCRTQWNVDDAIDGLQSIVDRIRNIYDDCIIDASAWCTDGYMHLTNSCGFNDGYRSWRQGIAVTALRILPDDTRIQIYENISAGNEFHSDDLIDRILMKLRFSERNAALPFGNYRVILTPKAFSQIMSVVLQGLSGKSLYKGVSRYIGKFGQKIFGQNVTVCDDPLINFAPGSYPFDGEGVPADKKTIIENGRIMRHIADLKSAHILHNKPTGNASRGYATLPQESFSNIIVPNGILTFEEMIAQVDAGIIIDQFIGFGQSNTLMGQFSANLDLAWLVDKGTIQGRLKNCMAADDVANMLDDTIVFSKEREWIGDAYLPFVMCRINFTSS